MSHIYRNVYAKSYVIIQYHSPSLPIIPHHYTSFSFIRMATSRCSIAHGLICFFCTILNPAEKNKKITCLTGYHPQDSLKLLCLVQEIDQEEINLYSRLSITRTRPNLNLALTRNKIDFPWISFIYLLLLYPR